METVTKSKLSPDNRSTKFLAGAGIVALLIVAVWLGTQAVQFGTRMTAGLAASLSGVRTLLGTGEDIIVAADPGVVASEDAFTLSWEHLEQEAEGSYTFSYECTEGVHLSSGESTNMNNVVFCNTPFRFMSENDQMTLSAISINDEPVEIELRIHFTPNGSEKESAVGTSRVTIVRDRAQIAGVATTTDTGLETAPESNPATTTSPTPQTRPGVPVTIVGTPTPVNDPNGTPDLRVRILEVGIVSSSGTFTRKTGALDPSQRVAVKFEVENAGTKSTGAWTLEARLPTERSMTWTPNQKQESILPGTRVEYTLGFDDVEDDEDTVTFRVEVDSEKDVTESNENNNTASVNIQIKT